MTEIQSDKLFSAELFAFKIYSLYNLIQTALSSYSNNLRNFLDRCAPPKITDLLNDIVHTTIICVQRKLFDEEDFVVQVRISTFFRN